MLDAGQLRMGTFDTRVEFRDLARTRRTVFGAGTCVASSYSKWSTALPLGSEVGMSVRRFAG
jgi:hypothetical protein